MPKILIIDDEIEICKQVSLILTKNSYECDYVTSYDDLKKYLSIDIHFDVALVDLWLKNSSKQGLDIISELSINFKNLLIISFSGHANIDNAIESVKAGANDFIEKPFETKKLLHIIQKNLLELQNKVSLQNYRNKISFHSKINNIGFSDDITNIINKSKKILVNDMVLISGPTGVGKNYLANIIHRRLSNNNPDTFINLSETLFNEADLFKINSLHNYFTIYINDYEKYNQIEVLNFTNLINNKKINATIILDTKKLDISEPYIKLFKFIFQIKKLSERKSEIFYIFKHYISEFASKKFENDVLIDDEIKNILTIHSWPGNIFEIMNLAENIVNLLTANNLTITVDLVQDLLNSSPKTTDLFHLNYKEAKEKFEKDYLIQKLEANNWNMTSTAKMLKLDRVSLYRKIKSLNIKIQE